jgi:hypothetical protein
MEGVLCSSNSLSATLLQQTISALK